MKEMVMKTMLLRMKYLKVASIVLLLTFTATHFSWAKEMHNDDDILDFLPGILAASKLSPDYDGDDYTENQGDCNDGQSLINPAAEEICGDGIDQNCSGADSACLGDTNFPELTALSITPNVADVSNGPVSVQVSVDAMDDSSGIDYILVDMQNPTSGGIWKSVIFHNPSGTTTIEMSTDSIPGDYSNFQVIVVDGVGNRRDYFSAEIESLGFSTGFIVEI